MQIHALNLHLIARRRKKRNEDAASKNGEKATASTHKGNPQEEKHRKRKVKDTKEDKGRKPKEEKR